MRKYLTKYREIIVYIIAGVLTTIVYYITRFATHIFSDNSVFCACVAQVVSILFAFFINKYWVFRSKDKSFKTMLIMAIATSIDALAVGVTFAFLSVRILPAISLIGLTTFVCSAAGVKIGNLFGLKYKSRAELFGGVVLIAIGLKILIEHLFFGG